VLLGRHQEAERLFERLVATANDLYLFAEQYDAKSRRLLGNYPQAFSHVALVTSAAALRSLGQIPVARARSLVKAIVVQPGVPKSLQLMEVDDAAGTDCVIVETVAIGVCGTDMEIIERGHGALPSGRSHLVLGHESVGRVLRAPDGCGFSAGMLVTGIVRRPDPEPCACCAEGNWDMCLKGRYTERGIKELDGFASERVAVEPEFLVSIDRSLAGRAVLVEPTSIASKAWRKIDDFSLKGALTRFPP